MTSFHVGDRVSRRLNDQVFHGVVVGIFEDIFTVLWDNGVLATLDEATLATVAMDSLPGYHPLWLVESKVVKKTVVTSYQRLSRRLINVGSCRSVQTA